MTATTYTSIHFDVEDVGSVHNLPSKAISIDLGDHTLFCRTPTAALHPAHLLRVAAGVEEARTEITE